MNHLLPLCILLLALTTSCARFTSTVTERTLPDGSNERVTVVRAAVKP